MLTVIYCTRESKPNHTEHIKKTSGIGKFIQVIEIINNGESLTTAYNRGLKQAINDIVVFCHDDLTIETTNWGNKLIKLYEKNPEYGIIGVAGTKYMSSTGRWWDKRKAMYGRVQHTHEGKTWLNSYSDDIHNKIEETVIVDGLFFALHKKRIVYNFDETFEGFHFYDVGFCFRNYINGVKIGIVTNIRINHLSIGMTNDAWEANRIKFAELYKHNLPVTIKKTFNKGEEIKVLIGCLSFKEFTGSELYNFELAKELVKQGCDVTVCSQIGDPLAKLARQHGIKTAPFDEPPSYKKGDGKWQIQTQEGLKPTQENALYKIADINFDVLHLSHKPMTEHLLKLYPETDAICSIHSEVINLEHPVIHPQIKKYIAIRPEIKQFLINEFKIEENKIDVVYNPIDYNRFKIVNVGNNNRTNKRILFVGTIDYLRRETIQDLINTTREEKNELWIVGRKNGGDDYLTNMILNQPHVKYFDAAFEIEKYIHQCDEVAGILLGRTTIEGWMCGKPAWIYDIDSSGTIKSKSYNPVPNDIDKFKSDNVAKQIIEKYKEIIE